MDQPIRRKPLKPRIRVYRDERGFTQYEVSIGESVIVWTHEFRAAWRWATRIFRQVNA